MCGILGIWHSNGDAVDLALLRRMATSLRHRGPDDEGYLLVDFAGKRAVAAGGRDTVGGLNLPDLDAMQGRRFPLALACRRLAIMDLSPAGHQPMVSADGRYAIVFNGEIYNHVELRRDLEKRGRPFRSHCDTEVLLAAWAEWGKHALWRLVGMFAFVIVDLTERKLFLARDFAGMKPLYYTQCSGCFAFASEIKAILTLPWVSRRAMPGEVFDYLRFGHTDHSFNTMFSEIQQVYPGSYVGFSLDENPSSEGEQYWNISDRGISARELSIEDAASRLRELFLESVRLHLRSDVPVGSCLSGGIDSSSIVGAIRKSQPDTELHTFTYCAEGSLDEEEWANRIIKAALTHPHKIRLQREMLKEELDRVIRVQDEPFGGTSILAQYCVFRAAREQKIPVLLDGQGADELLAGYSSFISARFASLIRQCRFLRAINFLGQAAGVAETDQIGVLKEAAGLLLPDSISRYARQAAGKPFVPTWINGDWFMRHHVPTDLWSWRRTAEPFRGLRNEVFRATSLPMLLRYEDRNAMAHSIESRLPFLTPELAEFIFALPDEYLLDDNAVSKSVFRLAMRGIVPDAILDRRDKIGFATPECDWLIAMESWVNEALASSGPATRVLRMENIGSLWDAVREGDRRSAAALWRCVNLILWADAFAVEFD